MLADPGTLVTTFPIEWLKSPFAYCLVEDEASKLIERHLL